MSKRVREGHQQTDSSNCVEVAHAPGAVHVRDSKTQGGPRFVVSPVAWREFLRREWR